MGAEKWSFTARFAQDAKTAKGSLLVCYDPERKTQDQNRPSPDGRLMKQKKTREIFGPINESI